jgi:hypothetical protein
VIKVKNILINNFCCKVIFVSVFSWQYVSFMYYIRTKLTRFLKILFIKDILKFNPGSTLNFKYYDRAYAQSNYKALWKLKCFFFNVSMLREKVELYRNTNQRFHNLTFYYMVIGICKITYFHQFLYVYHSNIVRSKTKWVSKEMDIFRL